MERTQTCGLVRAQAELSLPWLCAQGGIPESMRKTIREFLGVAVSHGQLSGHSLLSEQLTRSPTRERVDVPAPYEATLCLYCPLTSVLLTPMSVGSTYNQNFP